MFTGEADQSGRWLHLVRELPHLGTQQLATLALPADPFAALNENWCLRAVVQSRLRTMLAQWSGSSLLAAVLQWKNFTTVLEMTKQRVPRAELVILGRRVDELEAELNHCEAERRALQAKLQLVGRERDLMTTDFEEERLRLQTRINDAMFLATKSSWIQRN